MHVLDRWRGILSRRGLSIVGVTLAAVGGIALSNGVSAVNEPPVADISGITPEPGSPKELEFLQTLQRREELDAQRARTGQQERLDELFFEQSAIERTIEQLDELIAASEADLAKDRAKLTTLESKRTTIAESNAVLRTQMLAFLDELQQRVEQGIPWKRDDRLDQIEKAKALVASDATSPAAAIQSLDRLAKEHEALGRLVESQKLEISLESGDRIAVQAFHLGHLAVIFANETGDILGYAGPGQTLEEGLAIVEDKPEAADGYLLASDILRRRRTPQLVDIFMPGLRVDGKAKP